ncbi:MAG: aspartate-semialdehyde dehydrogenase [Sorangiineae bacterium]|nr:aspartate-semialdehyde dehydrogenase [Polyangiaceae bacterium]MEB2323427.1 aspartate-semialdehyde dehydrogenase [Sorangiineae bacterium]
MKTVGIVGFRGMVGSVLVERMRAERDFDAFEPLFFSTSQAGARAPELGREVAPVADAGDLDALRKLEIVVSCQGGDYTKAVHGELRRSGWKGYFIDAASTLRMEPDAVIVLDPVNRALIDAALARGVRDFVGGNCTVSLMLMAMHGLFARGWVEWVSSMTYQAASGAGARQMRELVQQMRVLADAGAELADDPASSILELDRAVAAAARSEALPRAELGAALAGSLIPWIDRAVDGGRTREEWKGSAETNKILALEPPVPVDGICVRVGAMRCHSQGLVVKLREDVPLAELEQAVGTANDWVRLVANDKEATLAELSPAAVSGTLAVPVGRLHKLEMGPTYLGAFTVGDQLLWGAAEPLRRMLRILLEHLG